MSNMDMDYMKVYRQITQGFVGPAYKYTTPDEQGAAIKKCTILEPTNIQYGNKTNLTVLEK